MVEQTPAGQGQNYDQNQGYNQNQQYYDGQQQQYNQGYQQPVMQGQQQPPYDGAQQQNFYTGGYDQSQQQYNQGYDQTQQYPNQQPAAAGGYPNTPGPTPAAAGAPGQDPNESVYIAGNDGYMELSVGEPVLHKAGLKDYHSYPVRGRDSLGDIEAERRFNNFFEFRKCLILRYPGLYIPPIPTKKQNATGDDVIRERQYFLDLFLKECCQLKYLCQSKEMQIFLRPQGDLEKCLQKMYKPKTNELIATYRATLDIQEHHDEREVKILENDVSQFVADQKILNEHLVKFKDTLKAIVPIKEQEKQHYQQFSQFLENYENTRNARSENLGELAHVSLFGGQNSELLQKLQNMVETHQNPMVHIAHWVKSSVWCLDALAQAIAEKDNMEAKKRSTQQGIADLTEDINKLNAGKFSFKAILKNDAEKKQSAVEKGRIKQGYEQDVVNYDVLKKYLTIYLATVAIPNYKTARTQAYIRAMGRFADAEVRNSENTFDCWTNFQKKIQGYNIKY